MNKNFEICFKELIYLFLVGSTAKFFYFQEKKYICLYL